MTPDIDNLFRLAEAATPGERASGFAHWGKYDLTIPIPNQDRKEWRGLFINGVPHIKICDHVLSKEDSDYLLATQPSAMIALCKEVKELRRMTELRQAFFEGHREPFDTDHKEE